MSVDPDEVNSIFVENVSVVCVGFVALEDQECADVKRYGYMSPELKPFDFLGNSCHPAIISDNYVCWLW